MILNCRDLPWAVGKPFINILQDVIRAAGLMGVTSGAVVTFKEPDYHKYSGEYHPIEIAVNEEGKIQYIAQFALFGAPPNVVLKKDIEFDFCFKRFHHARRLLSIHLGEETYKEWEEYFINCYECGLYKIEVLEWVECTMYIERGGDELIYV